MKPTVVTPDQAEGMDDCAEWAHCQGPCNQGRGLCPCPEACHVPRERMGPLSSIERWTLNHPTAVALLTGIAAICALAFLLAVSK